MSLAPNHRLNRAELQVLIAACNERLAQLANIAPTGFKLVSALDTAKAKLEAQLALLD